ncbi:MAG: CRISPR-associated RAMP protein Csx7 [Ktedonobacteraceae bacterium]
MVAQENRYELRNRYLFQGSLVMLTAFHIGGGRATLSSSNSPVVLTPAGMPFIPGASFKGALRSTIEKLVPGLPPDAGLSSCALIDLPEDEQTRETDKPKGEKRACPTVRQRAIVKYRREQESQGKNVDAVDEMENLCNTCLLFGSPFAAARINVSDLYISDQKWLGGIQVRDGVAIDRDSERAKDRLKYDFEVIPVGAKFTLSLVLENATPQDLQLISVGLSEFVHGFGVIGGKRSRGLGVCELQDLTVSSLELVGQGIQTSERNKRLQAYLVHKKFSTENEPGEQFLEKHINTLF